jgi:hypothetical protein
MSWKKIRILLFSLLVLPASTNYKMEGFDFGNAGGGNVGSSNYSMEGNVGEIGSQKMSGNSFDLGAGLMFVRQANVPKVASFTNPNNYYNKLRLVIDNQGNPSDAIFAVAISPDNFTTTYYVKNDHTIGMTLVNADYQSYALWGGASGVDIIGLQPSTTYSLKIKAMQGKFSETGYGPVVTAATVAPTLTFDIDVAATDIQTTPPYIVDMGNLYPGNVVTGTDKIWVSLDTNGNSGASVYVYGKNGGLSSVASGYTISAVSGDLGSLSTGFGAQGVGATQTSGGPLAIDVGYTGSGNVVGITDTLVRQIFLATNPLTGGRASFAVKAKSDNNTPAASDYTETLTVVAAANF